MRKLQLGAATSQIRNDGFFPTPSFLQMALQQITDQILPVAYTNIKFLALLL